MIEVEGEFDEEENTHNPLEEKKNTEPEKVIQNLENSIDINELKTLNEIANYIKSYYDSELITSLQLAENLS